MTEFIWDESEWPNLEAARRSLGQGQAVSETGQAEKDRRYARVDALTDTQRQSLLAYLCGYAPKGVDTWLDELESAEET